jgi:hypothetical protein
MAMLSSVRVGWEDRKPPCGQRLFVCFIPVHLDLCATGSLSETDVNGNLRATHQRSELCCQIYWQYVSPLISFPVFLMCTKSCNICMLQLVMLCWPADRQ